MSVPGKRVRGIAVRDELTDEWDQRGVKYEKEYAILTAEISKATFGLTPGEYNRFKGLTHQNLSDHIEVQCFCVAKSHIHQKLY
jgi:DNA-damage-inducible protein D